MKKKDYIEIRVTNKDNTLTPEDVDINDIKEILSGIETFLYPKTTDKKNRPHIAYSLEKGSAKHIFFVPATAVILFSNLTAEIKQKNSINFLDPKRREIIEGFQKKAKEKAYNIELSNSVNQQNSLEINANTSFVAETDAPKLYESEFYLYGEIYQQGGKKPNIHISTEEHGNLTIKATKEQITEGEKKTYKTYGIKVRGKKSLDGKTVSDLELLEFVHRYEPARDDSVLESMIEKASKNLSKIKNVDEWVNEIKGEI